MASDVASPNERLTRELVPAPVAGWDENQRFALPFHGYGYFGAFER